MQEYPAIPGSGGQSFRAFQAHVFDKLDGWNLRFEWSRKKGWHKQGTKTRLFDETDNLCGEAVTIFHTTLAKPLHDIAVKQRWDRVAVFAEFYGEKTLGGIFVPGEPRKLTIFDAALPKTGVIPPKEFLKIFGKMPIANYLGQINWSRKFVEDVWEGRVEGITFEGVVGKGKPDKRGPVMAKAKTYGWVEAVRASYPEHRANEIINS